MNRDVVKYRMALTPDVIREVEVNSVAAMGLLGRLNRQVDTAIPSNDKARLGRLLDSIVDTILGDLPALVTALGGVDALVAVVQSFYRSRIAPIDLPWIPNLIEPRFDLWIESALGAMIRAAFEKVNPSPVVGEQP